MFLVYLNGCRLVLWQIVLPIPVPVLLLKSIANTNTFVTILLLIITFSNVHFFLWLLVIYY